MDPIPETLVKAHQGLQFPINDLRCLYSKVDPVMLLVVENVHRRLIEADRLLCRLVEATASEDDR